MVIADNPVQLDLQTDSANSDMDRWDPATPEPEKQVFFSCCPGEENHHTLAKPLLSYPLAP